MKQQTKKRWLRVAACVACIFLLRAGCDLQYRQVAEIKTSEKMVTMEQYEPIDFVMSGIVKVNKSKGIDSPYSILNLFGGYDDYYFKGSIRYDDKKTRLKIHWHEPIAMFSNDGDVFLLCKAYWFRKSSHNNILSLYRLNKNGRRFTRTNINDNPGLYNISFTDHKLERMYKLWCVWNVLDTKHTAGKYDISIEERNEAVVLFNRFASENPRVFVKQNCDTERGDFIFADLIRVGLDLSKIDPVLLDGFWDSLVKIILNTEAHDDYNEMDRIHSKLYGFDKKKAKEIEKRWWEAAEAENVENDHRLEVRDYFESTRPEREAYRKRKSQEKEQ